MNQDLKAAASLVGPNATLLLHDVRGRTILAAGGRLWITQERDPQDIFLETGQRFTVERPGDTVLQALGGRAAVVVLDPAPAANDDMGIMHGNLGAAIDAEAARLVQRRGAAGTTERPSLEQIEIEARRLRLAALSHLAGRVATAAEAGWRRLQARLAAGGNAGYAP